MAPSITDHYDLVFIDQRGIGPSQPVRCDEAAAAYYQSTTPTRPIRPSATQVAAAQTLAEDCVAEMEASGVDPNTLPFYGTDQAIEDLEAFRIWLGAEQMVLYGESYGTQFVQTYAAAHPDCVPTLLIDGPVDLTVSGPDYWVEGTRRSTTWSRRPSSIARRRRRWPTSPVATPWPPTTGWRRTRPGAHRVLVHARRRHDRATDVHAGDLEIAAGATSRSLADRMLLQRAVAAAAGGDLVALARLAYLSCSPIRRHSRPTPTHPSDAPYYAVECQDYSYLRGAGTPMNASGVSRRGAQQG